MDDPELWRWIWLAGVGVFAVGEIAVAGSFFMLPFAVGSLAAAIAAFTGSSIALQWLLFVVMSALGAIGLIPLRRRLDKADPQDGVGSRRLLGQDAIVTMAIGPGPGVTGTVRLGREDWRAESVDHRPLAEGTVVKVVDVKGTAVIVRHVGLPAPSPGGAPS